MDGARGKRNLVYLRSVRVQPLWLVALDVIR